MKDNTYTATKIHSFNNEILVAFFIDANFFKKEPQKVLEQIKDFYDYNYTVVCNDENITAVLEKQYKISSYYLEYQNEFEGLKKIFKYALNKNFKFVVQFNTDYQYNILEIQNLFSKALYGFDVVVGNRTNNQTFINFYKNKSLSKLLKFKKININDPYCFFRIFNWNYMQLILENNILPDISSYSKLTKKYAIKIIDTNVSIRKNNDSYINQKYHNDNKFYLSTYFKTLF